MALDSTDSLYGDKYSVKCIGRCLEHDTVYYDMTPIVLRIREMREVKGWSQVELGKRAGVRQATISHLESGNAKAVDLTVLEKIAKALGVAPGYLIVKKGK